MLNVKTCSALDSAFTKGDKRKDAMKPKSYASSFGKEGKE